MRRPTAEKRHNDWWKAIRKRNLDRELDNSPNHSDWYNNLHQYSKNKIHCSCPLCAAKRRTNSIQDVTICERKRMEEMTEQIEDLMEEVI